MLSPQQINQYHTDGFTACEGFLSAAEVDRFRVEIEEICSGNTLARHDQARMEMEPDQPPEGTRVRRIYQPCDDNPEFRHCSESARLLDCVEQLLGPDLLLQYSKINMKPADVGSIVEWHQDLAYYPLTNRDSLAVLFYLDDASRRNGCLQIIPGRHTGSLMSHTRDGPCSRGGSPRQWIAQGPCLSREKPERRSSCTAWRPMPRLPTPRRSRAGRSFSATGLRMRSAFTMAKTRPVQRLLFVWCEVGVSVSLALP